MVELEKTLEKQEQDKGSLLEIVTLKTCTEHTQKTGMSDGKKE